MFKTVIILCIIAQQQCFEMGHEKEHGTVYKTQHECEIVAEYLADELSKKVKTPAVIRYGCEKADTI